MLHIGILMIVLLLLVLWVYTQDEHQQEKSRIPIARVQSYWNGVERRREDRISLVFRARYQLIKDLSNSTNKPSLTDNVSVGGLKLVVHEKLNTDDEVFLEIEITPYDLLKCRGKVTWVKELSTEEKEGEELEKRSFAVGLSFTALSSHAAERLKALLNTGHSLQNLPVVA